MLPAILSKPVRLFFGCISKTNKTLVDDHVIAEARAGFNWFWQNPLINISKVKMTLYLKLLVLTL